MRYKGIVEYYYSRYMLMDLNKLGDVSSKKWTFFDFLCSYNIYGVVDPSFKKYTFSHLGGMLYKTL